MTKYVVNSGGIIHGGDYGRSYLAEILKGLGDQPKLLLCFFANPTVEWQEKFSVYIGKFEEVLPGGVKPVFELALLDNFTDQVAQCDAIYIHGGENNRILSALHRYDAPDIWRGKVVATNSASSIALAAQSWTCDERRCVDGLGILPIRFIAHYQSDYGNDDPRGPIDWQKAYDELAKYGDTDLPMHALKEGEFIVMELS